MAILELRAAEGGNDAKLFVEDLSEMYRKYSRARGWVMTEMNRLPGYRMFEVAGEGALEFLSGETGGHRVQRVPPTEKAGRRHSSTITVAVLPKAELSRILVENDDVKLQTCRAGGHGGQNVNKRSTAVRLIHEKTGTVVNCREERRQGQNRQKALAKLERRLNQEAQTNHSAQESAIRRDQVGSGMRGDKVRTYNFRENRVTDHKTGKSTHRLAEVLAGQLGLIR